MLRVGSFSAFSNAGCVGGRATQPARPDAESGQMSERPSERGEGSGATAKLNGAGETTEPAPAGGAIKDSSVYRRERVGHIGLTASRKCLVGQIRRGFYRRWGQK
ncbi:hypothetical protein ES702_05078 [subsurface metagenome]